MVIRTGIGSVALCGYVCSSPLPQLTHYSFTKFGVSETRLTGDRGGVARLVDSPHRGQNWRLGDPGTGTYAREGKISADPVSVDPSPVFAFVGDARQRRSYRRPVVRPTTAHPTGNKRVYACLESLAL